MCVWLVQRSFASHRSCELWYTVCGCRTFNLDFDAPFAELWKGVGWSSMAGDGVHPHSTHAWSLYFRKEREKLIGKVWRTLQQTPTLEYRNSTRWCWDLTYKLWNVSFRTGIYETSCRLESYKTSWTSMAQHHEHGIGATLWAWHWSYSPEASTHALNCETSFPEDRKG